MNTLRVGNIFIYAFLIGMSLFFIIPFYVMVITSFKPAVEATIDNIWTLPTMIDFSGIQEAFAKLAPSLWNSILLVIPATVISSFLGSFNGYIISKWKFRGSETIFTLLLFGMFMPHQTILLPLVVLLQKIGLYNTITGLAIVHIIYGLPVTTLIFRNFYTNIPNEMLEAGKIDGCGLFGIYKYLILPLSIPGFVVVGIWQFTSIWNEFLMAATITSVGSQPIMVALMSLSGAHFSYWNMIMAGSLLAALPTMIVYITLSRFFIKGLMAGSIKG